VGQVVAMLSKAEKLQAHGSTIPQACSQETFYHWRIYPNTDRRSCAILGNATKALGSTSLPEGCHRDPGSGGPRPPERGGPSWHVAELGSSAEAARG
jgi:hypothetical protein